MHRYSFALLAILLTSFAPGRSSSSRLQVATNVRVTSSPAPHVEPHIAAHPQDARSLVISGSEVVNGQGIVGKAFYTDDAGRSWHSVTLPRPGPSMPQPAGRLEGDSWVTYSPEGIAYLSILSGNNVFVYRSHDKGHSWLGPAVISSLGSFDAPHVFAATTRDGPRVFVTVLVDGRGGDRLLTGGSPAVGAAVFRSDDGGASFQRTAFITHDYQLAHNALNPVLLQDGALLVPFNEYPLDPRAQPLTSSRFYVARSEDGGQTFGLPYFVAEIPRMFPHRPRFAVDRSDDTFRGRIYASWDGGRNDDRQVAVASSADGGRSWTAPVLFRAAGAGPVYYATLAVGHDGTVGVAWLQHEVDRRQCYRVYFAASRDGGRAFATPEALSDAISCPDTEQNKGARFPPDNESAFGRWVRGGDYFGITAAADGSFHAVWSDSRDGAFQFYTARIQVKN